MNLTIHPVRPIEALSARPPAAPRAAPADEAPPPEATELTATPEARIRHLFRRLSRAGLVHPLQHLVLRYRAGELV